MSKTIQVFDWVCNLFSYLKNNKIEALNKFKEVPRHRILFKMPGEKMAEIVI